MIAVYIRVSTREQNLETQSHVIRDWLGNREALWFADENVSGDTVARPGFRKLREAVRDGRITHVVVFRLDRISRRTATGVSILHGWLDKNVRVTSVMENLDIDPSNHAVVDIVVPLLFGLAANEQRVRRQRQKSGIERAKAEGRYQGRKPGSTTAKPSRARALKRRGLTLMEIAASLGVSKATVCRYLREAA